MMYTNKDLQDAIKKYGDLLSEYDAREGEDAAEAGSELEDALLYLESLDAEDEDFQEEFSGILETLQALTED